MSALFLLLTGWQEVVCTFEAEAFGHALEMLRTAGIATHTRTTNCGSTNRRSGTLGAFGELPGRSIEYQIFVRKADLAKARLALQGRLETDPDGTRRAK